MVSGLWAGEGKIRVSSDQKGSDVYVNGKKKAVTGEGFSTIVLKAGTYTVKVVKPIDENYEYVQSKEIYVGDATSTKLNFKLERNIRGKAQETAGEKKQRWQRIGEVVTDTKLSMMWQDNAVAKSSKMKWESAKQYCQNLSMADSNDWRLPTYDELLPLVDYSRYNPSIVPGFKNVGTSVYYWTSSVYEPRNERIRILDFSNGGAHNGDKADENYVRCVRGGQ